MRFKNPHRPILSINGGGPLAFVAILGSVLPFPGFIGCIILIQTMIKIPSQTADDALISGIRKTQSSRGQSSQMSIRGHYDDGFSIMYCFYCGDDGRRSTSIHDNIRAVSRNGFLILTTPADSSY